MSLLPKKCYFIFNENLLKIRSMSISCGLPLLGGWGVLDF